MYNTRHFPAYDGVIPDVYEMVKAQSYDRSATEIWEGPAELKYYPDTLEDLQAIAPIEMIKGYRFSFADRVTSPGPTGPTNTSNSPTRRALRLRTSSPDSSSSRLRHESVRCG